jgi:hypothetical protein
MRKLVVQQSNSKQTVMLATAARPFGMCGARSRVASESQQGLIDLVHKSIAAVQHLLLVAVCM